MSRIRGKDTKPELLIRSALHARGFRYRLHLKNLPGTPDIAFISRKKAIFVHGCFWHQHPDCPRASIPKTNRRFWKKKFKANAERDAKAIAELQALGWKTLIVWECELKNADKAMKRIIRFIERKS